jgi:hypothetical protein
MKTVKTLAALLLVSASTVCAAEDAKFSIGIEVGQTKVGVDANVTQIGEEFKDTGYSFGYLLGYQWENNMVAEANFIYSSNDGLFRALDHFESSESKFMLGYSYQANDYLRIVPMIGLSQWKVEGKEGEIFAPGPEAKNKFDGTDLTYKLKFEIPVKKLIVFSISFAKTNIDIGDINMTQLGAKFEF